MPQTIRTVAPANAIARVTITGPPTAPAHDGGSNRPPPSGNQTSPWRVLLALLVMSPVPPPISLMPPLPPLPPLLPLLPILPPLPPPPEKPPPWLPAAPPPFFIEISPVGSPPELKVISLTVLLTVPGILFSAISATLASVEGAALTRSVVRLVIDELLAWIEPAVMPTVLFEVGRSTSEALARGIASSMSWRRVLRTGIVTTVFAFLTCEERIIVNGSGCKIFSQNLLVLEYLVKSY
ncbi:hypothetical protein F4824DRAFT_413202 [Ustulina deusta]|nr:hypothetical protein F4824DRAFT_413202 [Ustulina deusta]